MTDAQLDMNTPGWETLPEGRLHRSTGCKGAPRAILRPLGHRIEKSPPDGGRRITFCGFAIVRDLCYSADGLLGPIETINHFI